MDKIIEQSWLNRNRKWLWWSGIALIVLMALLFVAFSGQMQEIRSDKIRTGEVTYGDFQEIILANGFVEPKRTVLIDANEGGTVQSIQVEDGDLVTAGDVLVVLTNEALMLDYMQRETQIVEQINNLRNTRINLDQNFRLTEDQLAEYTKELTLAEKQFQVDSAMYVANGLAQKVYDDSRTTYLFLKNKVAILSARKTEDKTYQFDQIRRIDHSIALMERNLEIIRGKLSEMSIRAPISGRLSSFNLEPGQVLQRNTTVGRIDEPDNFWIRALVDQHYLNRISVGQNAHVNMEDSTFNLAVSRVQSTVVDGQMEIYLDFKEKWPNDLVRGQNVQVFVEISAKKEAVKIPRGSFYQSSGGQFVFVLSSDGTSAYKRSVIIGRQNPDFYEVVEGLVKGEVVITSSYENYKDKDEISIIDPPN